MWKKSINVKCHLFSAQESTLTVGEKKNWGGKVCHVFPHFNIITVISRWQNYEILTMAEQTWLITTHGLVHAISHRASEVNFLCDTLSPLLLVPLHTKHPWHSFPHHHLTIYNFSLSFVGGKKPYSTMKLIYCTSHSYWIIIICVKRMENIFLKKEWVTNNKIANLRISRHGNYSPNMRNVLDSCGRAI